MPGPVDPDRPASSVDEERRHRSTVRHSWGTALLGAAVVIVPALIGGGVAQSKGALHIGAVPTVTTTITERTTLTATPVAGTAVSESTRAGSVALSHGYCIDLDSTAPDWSVTSNCPTIGAINGDADLRYYLTGQTIDMLNQADIAVLDSGDAGTQTFCQSVTAYEQSIAVRALRVGQRYCVRTSSRHNALLQLTALNAANNDLAHLQSATFAFTNWSAVH